MADTSDIVQDINNLIVHEITILGKFGERYEIYPSASNFVYQSLAIAESMFEASLVGTLKIRDLNSIAEQINFSGFEDLIIKIENPDISGSYKSLLFKIYSVDTSEDQISTNLIKQDVNIPKRFLSISFTSYEHYLLSHKEFTEIAGLTGSDVITKISTPSRTIASETSQILDVSSQIGFVNALNDRFFKTGKDSETTQKPMFIEGSSNWIWYKQNQLMYPWGKLNRPIRISQLMQYLAEYATSQSNPFACNFLFWQDMDRWNFRSIESLLQQPAIREYAFRNNNYDTGNIFNLKIISETNFLRLFESNAISSKYYLVEPNWNNPYREYTDYNDAHTIKEVTYDYFRDYNKWLKVEKYPIFDKSVSTKPTAANVINDNVSGYFDKTYNNRDKTVTWDHHGYTFSNRDGFETWQPMFDQTDLDGETCKLIQKEIKQKIKDKKVEYAKKKNLKEKWKVYKCSICCDTRNVDLEEEVFTPQYGVAASGGFTDLVNYDKIAGSTLDGQFPAGLSFSYEFGEEPFNKTIGELMYFREVPDIQTKYLYDLEIKKLEIAKERLDAIISRLNFEKQNVERIPVCIPGCCQTTEDTTNIFSSPECFDENYTSNICFCSEEKKNSWLETKLNPLLNNLQQIRSSNYFDGMIAIIENEKQNFAEKYEQYRNRKAFFVSKEMGFTASSLNKNLLNVRSIKRKPIRGSKYEKLAHKTVLSELISGITFNYKGFPTGTTSYYPYDVYYNNDSSINPKEKHPHYDSGYNFDLGFNSNVFFSRFDEIGGPHSDSNNSSLQYYTSVRFNVRKEGRNEQKKFNFGVCQETKSEDLEIDITNEEIYDRNPENLSVSNLLNRKIEQIISSFFDPTYEIQRTENTVTFVKRINYESYIVTFQCCTSSGGFGSDCTVYYTNSEANVPETCEILQTETCDSYDQTTIKYTIELDSLYSDNKGNPQLPESHICTTIIGLDRIPDFNFIDYLNSRNFIQLPEAEENPKPTKTILEEIESYVRIEFETPIGQNTVFEFPSGFYDTPGSEYYLPYHVLLTAGPFGSKSADYNVSVIGQDPYGFDVAVKRIKSKKQKLNVKTGSLINNKDYHVVGNGFITSQLFAPNFNRDIKYGDISAILDGYQSTTTAPRLLTPAQYRHTFSLTDAATDKQSINEDINNDSIIEGNWVRPDLYRLFSQTNSEHFYTDLLRESVRKNPLALTESYFEFNNIRPNSVSSRNGNNFGSGYPTEPPRGFYFGLDSDIPAEFDPEENFLQLYGSDSESREKIANLLLPGNVFGYVSYNNKPLPTDTSYFLSSVAYNPQQERPGWGISLFEIDLKNRNNPQATEEERSFYGNYYGVSIWTHPEVSENMFSGVWKNDITGETEYGIVGPQLEEDEITFDRNFAAQFVVISRQSIEDPCAGYPCSNPEPVNNSTCPDNDPLCNCPCQELRPDKVLFGITGPEPTYLELKQLETEIKECDLIENVLGEEWLGCVWGDTKNVLNCNCPCIGEKFLDYLRYSQTYCTFWNTVAERPLLRTAQMMQIRANRISIMVNGDLTLRPGEKVIINLGEKRYSGVWLVSSILHDIAKTKHYMSVELIRDSEYIDPTKRSKELVLNTEG